MGLRMSHRKRNSRRGRCLGHRLKARGDGAELRADVRPNSRLHHQKDSSLPSRRQEPVLRVATSLQGLGVLGGQFRTDVWPECQTVVVHQDVNDKREVLAHPVEIEGD
jgi:hypothetical protein